jgi:hypothetical protein
MSIYEVWKKNESKNLKVRYMGWSQIKYFTIDSIDLESRRVFGHLDTGESATYNFSSDHFELYYPGAELNCMLV